MGLNSNIQWTDSTWNPWYGCIKVAQGCAKCYMYRDFERWKKDPTVVQMSKTNFYAPTKWKEPQMVFTCSLSDFFIEQADKWRPEAWEIMSSTRWELRRDGSVCLTIPAVSGFHRRV